MNPRFASKIGEGEERTVSFSLTSVRALPIVPAHDFMLFLYADMFAVIEIAGHQYQVEKGRTFMIDQQNAEVGSSIDVDQVLLLSTDGKDAKVGAPYVAGAKVTLKVLENLRGEKVRVFKMKAKKRYRRTFGHRSYLTKVEVTNISA